MGFMTELRYKRDDLNEKLKEAPWWVWAAIGGVLLLIVLVPVMCSGGGGARGVSRTEAEVISVQAQLRAVFQEIIAKLSDPAQPQDIAQITQALVQEKGADFFKCPATGESYKLNPDTRVWLLAVPDRPAPPGPGVRGDALILTRPMEARREQGVAYIAVMPHGGPINLAAEDEPAWLAQALTPGG